MTHGTFRENYEKYNIYIENRTREILKWIKLSIFLAVKIATGKKEK